MSGKERKSDLYTILGVSKECSTEELRVAYKKLAMKWHPDRCSNPSSSICLEQANHKFQKIQGAYSVLSNSNKRFLYDVGAYDSDDEDSNTGLSEILDEVVEMMNNTNPNENGQESMEDMQRLFDEILFFSDGNAGSRSNGSKCEKRSFNGWDGSTSSDSSGGSMSTDPGFKSDRVGPINSDQFFFELVKVYVLFWV